MPKGKKVIVIGLDGASWDFIIPWISKGELPTLARMIKNGTWGKLESTIPPVTGPAWVSFATGKNPGKHGIYDFVYIKDGILKLHTSDDIKVKTIYRLLSERGFRNIVISLPFSYPPDKWFNGVMISDFLYPEKRIYPEIKRNYINKYKIIPDLYKKGEELLLEMEDTARRRCELAKTLFLNENWDFFFFWFGESDSVLHHFWKEKDMDTMIGKRVRRIYKIADDFLGWVLSRMGDDTILLLMSDHGFGDYPYAVNLNNIFRQHGFIKTKLTKRSISGEDETLAKQVEKMSSKKKDKTLLIFPSILSNVSGLKMIKKCIKKILMAMGVEVKVVTSHAKIDFESSKVFVPTPESLSVYVNERNMQKKEKIVNEVISLLKGLQFGDKLVFKRVLKKTEAYYGPFLEAAPDILLVPNGFFILTSISVTEETFSEFVPGSFHDMQGIFLAYGQGVGTGKEIKGAKIYDILPTILYIFGLPIPDDVDGKVLFQIFKKVREDENE